MQNMYSCNFGKHLTLAGKDEAWVSHEPAVPIPDTDPKETQVTVSTAALLQNSPECGTPQCLSTE